MPFIVYADLECIIEKTGGRKNNLENSSTTKVCEHLTQVFQCLQYSHLEASKISMVCTQIMIAWKNFANP